MNVQGRGDVVEVAVENIDATGVEDAEADE